MLPKETSEDKASLAENSYKVRRLVIRLAAPVPGSTSGPAVPAAALAAVPASDSGSIFRPAAPSGPTSSTVAFIDTTSAAASTSAMVLDDDPQGIYNASPDNGPRRTHNAPVLYNDRQGTSSIAPVLDDDPQGIYNASPDNGPRRTHNAPVLYNDRQGTSSIAPVLDDDPQGIYNASPDNGPRRTHNAPVLYNDRQGTSSIAPVLDDDPQGIYNASPDNSPRRTHNAPLPHEGHQSTSNAHVPFDEPQAMYYTLVPAAADDMFAPNTQSGSANGTHVVIQTPSHPRLRFASEIQRAQVATQGRDHDPEGIGSTDHLLDGLRLNPVDPNFTPPVFANRPSTVKNDVTAAAVKKPSVVNRLRSMVSMSLLPGTRSGGGMSNSRTTPNLRQSKSTYHFGTHKQQQYERISEENETNDGSDDGTDDGSLAPDALANHISKHRLMTEAKLSTPHAEPAPFPPWNASGLQPSGRGDVYRSNSAEETATGASTGTTSAEEAERLVKEQKKANRKARMYHKETGEAAGEIDMTIEVARDDIETDCVETGQAASAAQVDHLFPPWETRYSRDKKVSGVKKAWLKLEAWGKKFNRK
ncbi:uncharacterized protein L3040_007789 [Drepanopeziza brunnea f. sp. 'multigermtubi']|uniref:uncharacterized protein n=1 Tax=Drepanopeziza brunnea f. sp. 'multigermtubi' TaxID=698441 RepID=UPI002394BF10|nr:hypothetical protein L3040_007789 [Drepanopeziza brunnea f. sp. 'multigermtubi']